MSTTELSPSLNATLAVIHLSVQGKLDARLFKSVHDGKPNTAMGVWRELLIDDEIWDALAYVRTLAPERAGGMDSGLR